MPDRTWNSLEVVKLIVGFTTPAVIAGFGFLANGWIRNSDLARRDAEQERARSEARQAAVQAFSTFIYERRARAEMLFSALHRRAAISEVNERKRLYDEAYVRWNASHQANLLLIRQILEEREYTDFESLVESHLVRNLFKPLDDCLTSAYDARVRGTNPDALLRSCNVSALLLRSLNCGYALTDSLFRLSGMAGSGAEGGRVTMRGRGALVDSCAPLPQTP